MGPSTKSGHLGPFWGVSNCIWPILAGPGLDFGPFWRVQAGFGSIWEVPGLHIFCIFWEF